jgi:glucose-1-phosphate thymidylyltransferase
MLAAWAPRFTSFLHDWLQARSAGSAVLSGTPTELYLGHVMQAGIEAGLSIEVETFQSGSFIDVGTPAGFARALQRYGALGLGTS